MRTDETIDDVNGGQALRSRSARAKAIWLALIGLFAVGPGYAAPPPTIRPGLGSDNPMAPMAPAPIVPPPPADSAPSVAPPPRPVPAEPSKKPPPPKQP